jgi:hypothetical protein
MLRSCSLRLRRKLLRGSKRNLMSYFGRGAAMTQMLLIGHQRGCTGQLRATRAQSERMTVLRKTALLIGEDDA